MPGYHVLLEDFCEHLARDGFNVTLLLPRGDAPFNERKFRILEYGTLARPKGYPITFSLLRVLKDESFDLVATGEDFIMPSWICALRFFLTRKPLVLIQEKYFISRKSLLAPVHRLMLKTVCPLVWHASARILVHSRAAEKFLIESGGPPEKVEYLPVGVDVNKFSPGESRARSDTFSILSVARLIDHKGLGYLIEAIQLLRGKGRKVALRIVGDGPLKEGLQTLSKEKGVEDFVTITTHIDYPNMPNVYKSADIFVLPSVVEVFGVSVLEAMACGLPVVVTNVGGLPDLPLEGQNGFIVEPRDSFALATALERLLDYDRVEGMGKRSREIVLAKFDWAILARSYGNVFRSLEGQKCRK